MTAEHQRAIREAEARGDYQGASALRVRAALGEQAEPKAVENQEPSSRNPTAKGPATFPASRAQAIGQELLRLSNNVQRDLTRAQTLLGEMRGIAHALEQKR